MNTGYLIYQAERPRGAAEQRQTDIAHAELARAVSRRWHALTAPLRARRLARRRPGLPARYPATDYSTAECLATECLSGRPA
jgi:hypothetical protein